MAKLRKMLGDMESPECKGLREVIETQSKLTLGAWAVAYAKAHYLSIYEEECPGEDILSKAITECERFLSEEIKLADLKPTLKLARETASKTTGEIAQASARAIATACAAVQTPTNAFGFLLYGAAATVYKEAGLEESSETYDLLASKELARALESIKSVAVEDEPKPVKINWNC